MYKQLILGIAAGVMLMDEVATATAENQNAGGVAAVVPAVPKADAAAPVINALTSKENYLPNSYKFHFKKDDLGNKRPSIDLVLMTPTMEGVIAALISDEKQALYIIDVLSQEIYKAARLQVGDEQKPVNKQGELDTTKLTIEALANMPKAERTGGGISKEIWEAFSKDYIAVMPGITGKTAEQIANAAKLMLAKFQPVKTQKKVLGFLKDQLNLWYTSTTNAEEFSECYEFLDEKAKTLLAADEASLLANL